MRTFLICTVVMAAGIAVLKVAIGTPARAESSGLAAVAQRAVSDDSEMSKRAIQQLRTAGPKGLAVLVELLPPAEKAVLAAPTTRENIDPARKRLLAAVDAVAAQRDASVSRLYWHTDLEKARSLARRTNRPILSLHLLGKLTDEFSCANSRFFRTALYANREVSDLLREQFVLHWKTVRQVPRITVDFGDGRKLKNTITGNSIHYVLDSDGRLIDAVPGLYGPRTFMRNLESASWAIAECAKLPLEHRDAYLQTYHQDRSEQLALAWRNDLNEIGALAPGETAPLNDDRLRQLTSETHWRQIAVLHLGDAQLDAASRALMGRNMPNAIQAGQLAVTKLVIENPLMRLVAAFQRSIAEDTLRNEYLLHRDIHTWLAAAPGPVDLNQFNQRVYAELFLMPLDDPWLGLLPKNNYTALKRAGIVVNESAK